MNSGNTDIAAGHELRIALNDTQTCCVKVISGNCEICGTELGGKEEYLFSGKDVAIFSWLGCRVEITGQHGNIYAAEVTSMTFYLNIHMHLEYMRDISLANREIGPRVLIMGSPGSGKTFLGNVLLAYAVRLGRCPMYIDLDVDCGALGIPGCIGAAPVDMSTLSLRDGISQASPLLLYFGRFSVESSDSNVSIIHSEHYCKLVSTLAKFVHDRLNPPPSTSNSDTSGSFDELTASSGCIINCPSWVSGEGYKALKFAVDQFRVNVIIVVGHDSCHNELSNLFSQSATVIKLPSSPAATAKTDESRRRAREMRVHEYFGGYGIDSKIPPSVPLVAALVSISLSLCKIYRIIAIGSSASMHPVASSEADLSPSLTVEVISRCRDLTINCILAVMYTSDTTPLEPVSVKQGSSLGISSVKRQKLGIEDDTIESTVVDVSSEILKSNVAGFLQIKEIDDSQGIIKVWAPCEGNLPSRHFLTNAN